MKIFAMCMECQKELGHPSFEPIITDYYEGAVADIKCSRGHKSVLLLQSQKFEILLESAANALLEGYTIEAASTLSAAHERFIEFCIKVFCKKNATPVDALDKTFKEANLSERQLGAFLFLHLITLGVPYTLNKEIKETRNKIIHRGYIPMPEEVIKFGELIYQEIYSITQLIKSNLPNEMQQVIKDELQSKRKKLPPETLCATTSGPMFFSLSMSEQKKDFQEALAAYKEAREVICGSVPYMKLLSKAVLLYTKLRKGL